MIGGIVFDAHANLPVARAPEIDKVRPKLRLAKGGNTGGNNPTLL